LALARREVHQQHVDVVHVQANRRQVREAISFLTPWGSKQTEMFFWDLMAGAKAKAKGVAKGSGRPRGARFGWV